MLVDVGYCRLVWCHLRILAFYHGDPPISLVSQDKYVVPSLRHQLRYFHIAGQCFHVAHLCDGSIFASILCRLGRRYYCVSSLAEISVDTSY